MFFKAWTVRDNALEEGMPIMAFSKAMQELDRKHPGITVDQLPSAVALFQSPKAKQRASVRVEGQSEDLVFDKNGIAWAPAPSRVFLGLAGGSEQTLLISPNGTARLVKGLDKDTPLVDIPVGATPLVEQAARWLATGEVGASSQFMCATIAGLGADPSDRHPHPRDTADFERCLGFLRAVPEARSGLDKLKSASPQWESLVSRWDELEAAMVEKSDRQRAAAILDEILATPQPRRAGPR